jgi:ABC-type phosphate transport system substrate-binding protein
MPIRSIIELVLVAAMVLSALPASPSEAIEQFTSAACEPYTLPYVRDTVWSKLGHAWLGKQAPFDELGDEACYRQLIAGRVDLISVLRSPEEVGIRDFAQAFPPAGGEPKVFVIGHVAVTITAPSWRQLDRLSMDDLGKLLTGTITTWDELGGKGSGKALVIADVMALNLAASRAGVALVTTPEKAGWLIDEDPASISIENAFEHSIMEATATRPDAEPWASDLSRADYLWISVRSRPVVRPRRRIDEQTSRIPLVNGSGDTVSATLATVRDGTYPLSFTWRILVRPGARKQSEGAARWCVRSYDGTLQNTHSVEAWLIQPVAKDREEYVRVYSRDWDRVASLLCKAFNKSHPGLQANPVRIGQQSNFFDPLKADAADVVLDAGVRSKDEEGAIVEAWGAGSHRDVLVGRKPLLVLVPPANPIRSLTVEDARQIAQSSMTKWSECGWPEGAWVTKFMAHRETGSALFGDPYFPNIWTSRPAEIEAAAWEELERSCRRSNMTYAQLLASLADTPDGIGFLPPSERALASGLRVLRLGPGDGIEPTAQHVAEGRYPACIDMRATLRSDATKACQTFVTWLGGPEAAAILREHSIFNRHNASPTTAPDVARSKVAAKPGVTFSEPITGAVAVLPSESLSDFFLMADSRHLALYDEQLFEAIASDQRLAQVDRSEIATVLEEQRLVMTATGERTGKIVAADVLVLPRLVPDGTRTVLRIQAIHGQTASVLSELTLPVAPADPMHFSPSLPDMVTTWWPGVLARLAESRSRPVWTLTDIASGDGDHENAAEEIAGRLRQAMRTSDRAFLADYSGLDIASREVLMTMLGLASATAGSFTPAADFIVEGRVTGPETLEMRLIAGDTRGVLAETTIRRQQSDLADAAAAWLSGQVTTYLGKPPASAVPAENWAKAQARLEYARCLRVKGEADTFAEAADQRRLALGLAHVTDEDAARLSALRHRARRHARKAFHLDPTFEVAGITAWDMGRLLGDASAASEVESAMLLARLVATFPNSRDHRRRSEYLLSDCHATVSRYGDLATDAAEGSQRRAQFEALRNRALARCLDAYHAYATRYVRCHDAPGEKRGSWMGFKVVSGRYFHDTVRYLHLTHADDRKCKAAVASWSALFDAHPDAAPHSDFLRLCMARLRDDREGFIKHLSGMIARHGDRDDAYWKHGLSIARDENSAFFAIYPEQCGLTRWYYEKADTAAIPFEGYDPSKHPTHSWPSDWME